MEENKIGERLMRARKHEGLSMQELGDKVGMSKQAIDKYEKGKIKFTTEKLMKFGKALNKKLDYFLGKRPLIEIDSSKIHWCKNIKW